MVVEGSTLDLNSSAESSEDLRIAAELRSFLRRIIVEANELITLAPGHESLWYHRRSLLQLILSQLEPEQHKESDPLPPGTELTSAQDPPKPSSASSSDIVPESISSKVFFLSGISFKIPFDELSARVTSLVADLNGTEDREVHDNNSGDDKVDARCKEEQERTVALFLDIFTTTLLDGRSQSVNGGQVNLNLCTHSIPSATAYVWRLLYSEIAFVQHVVTDRDVWDHEKQKRHGLTYCLYVCKKLMELVGRLVTHSGCTRREVREE